MATPQANVIVLTGDLRIDYVTQGSAWTLGADRVLTYSFDLNFDAPSADWTPAWTSAVTAGFAAWEAVADIHFVQAGTINAVTQNAGLGDFSISLGPDPFAGFAGIAVFPDPPYADELLASLGYARHSGTWPFPRPEGDITYNPAVAPFTSLLPGSEGFDVILHEIGHALGLKHVDDDGGHFNRPVIHSTPGLFPSVMWSASAQDGYTFGGPTVNDILAIQHMYGANTSYRTGDDAYGLGQLNRYMTIWDAGGRDAFVAAPGGSNIDLRPGATSTSTLNPVGKLVIAYGVTIEDARGGAGNDVITGNDAANGLVGGRGIDGLAGGAGGDTLQGGDGNDTLQGEAGNDRLGGGEGVDSLDGGDGNDRLIGRGGADTFVFDVAPGAGNLDRIADFTSTVDEIVLDGTVFPALTAGGTLAPGEFRANIGGLALDPNDHVLYDRATGALYYDADGNGGGARVQIATLTGAPTLAREDVTVT